MSDTTTITPRKRKELREYAIDCKGEMNRNYFICHLEPDTVLNLLDTIEQAESRIDGGCIEELKRATELAEQAKARAERAESAQLHLCQWLSDIAVELGCACDNEAMLLAVHEIKARAEKAEAENARLRERLEAALDKIAEIQENDNWEKADGVCYACGICSGIPEDWQPTDDHNCRVMLELWADGELLPWEAARRAVADAESEVGE